MTYSRRRIALAPLWITLAIALAIVLAVGLATPRPAGAFIHEIIGALCNGRGEVIPPGQAPGGPAMVRALTATGFITSVDDSVPGQVTINFDVTVPNSKSISAGFDLPIPNGAGPGVTLILSPLPIADPNFPAHANCQIGSP